MPTYVSVPLKYVVTTNPCTSSREALPWNIAWTHPRTDEKYTVELKAAGNLGQDDLKACFDLIAETSRRDYEASTGGWHPKKKMVEMQSPDLRYILVRNDEGTIAGFTSLMPTFEEGDPVVYCYEIHLKAHLQGWAGFPLAT
jgi:hypothetical protein